MRYLGFRVHSSQTRSYVLLFCSFSNCIEEHYRNLVEYVSTYIINYQGLNSSVVITTYIVSSSSKILSGKLYIIIIYGQTVINGY